MSKTPGTVSKILWHFTGGPKWDNKNQTQEKGTKPLIKAYEALKGIIAEQELRQSSYREVIKHRGVNKVKKLETYEIEKVCCLADIPVQHLSYHAERYGKIAIGFHRNAVIDAKFNPVVYGLLESQLGQSISELIFWSKRDDIMSSLTNIKHALLKLSHDQKEELLDNMTDADLAINDLDLTLDVLLDVIPELLNNVKMLDGNDGLDNFYCEREWRLSGMSFEFSFDDVAMIVLPKLGRGRYYDRFLRELPENFPRHIPIVPWEDLIEH